MLKTKKIEYEVRISRADILKLVGLPGGTEASISMEKDRGTGDDMLIVRWGLEERSDIKWEVENPPLGTST